MAFDESPYLLRNSHIGFQNVDADGDMCVELVLFFRNAKILGGSPQLAMVARASADVSAGATVLHRAITRLRIDVEATGRRSPTSDRAPRIRWRRQRHGRIDGVRIRGFE